MPPLATPLTLWIAVAAATAAATHAVWRFLLEPLARRTPTQLDVMVVAQTRRPAVASVFTLVLSLGLRALARSRPDLNETFAWTAINGLVYVATVFAVTQTVYAAVRSAMDWYSGQFGAREAPARSRAQFMELFRKTAKFLFFFVAITIVFDHFGVQITGLLATAGVASVAVAMAAQETLSNMIAGFALIADHPFRPGDRVELANGKMGDVLEVGLRSTKIMAFDGTVIAIPNAEIAKNQIVNLNAPNPTFKIRATIGVAYGTDLRRVKRALIEVFAAHPEVLREPPPAVFFTEFAESSLTLFYVCTVADYHHQFRIRDELNMAIKDRFEADGIQIPFPQRDVYLRRSPDSPTPPESGHS